MNVNEALKEIEEGEKELELGIDSKVPTDVVVFGAIGKSGLDRHEFAFGGEEQNEFLEGLASIINKNNGF